MTTRVDGEAAGAIAVVDCGLGNLFSVQRACEYVGHRAIVTSSPESVAAARGVILPGVGAFGDAMKTLRNTGLGAAVQEAVVRGVPVLGVCLGMQLLLAESLEFGSHQGLGVVEGSVLPLSAAARLEPEAKVPHMGWSRVEPAPHRSFAGSPLAEVPAGSHLYFVHSFYASLSDESLELSRTTYRGLTFCSSFRRGNVFGCQFHPERSGTLGLSVYRRALAEAGDAMGMEGVV